MPKKASRDRFNDEEWALVKQGKCPYVIEYGMVPGRIVHCQEPIDPTSWYRSCPEHVEEMREDDTARGIYR